MKKLIFLFTSLVSPALAFAQSAVDDNLVINQVSDQYPSVHIRTYQGLIANGHPSLEFQNSGGTAGNVLPTTANAFLGAISFMGHDGIANVHNARIVVASTDAFSTGNYPSKMFFKIGGTTTCCGLDRMVIDGQTGFVGVGTTTPSEAFQIGDRWTFHNGGHKVIGYNYDYNGGEKRLFNDEASIIRFMPEGEIRLSTSGPDVAGSTIEWTNNLALKNNGRVGIGTASPEEKLHVNGTTTITGDIGVPADSHWKTGNHTLELTNSDGGDVVLSLHRQGYSNASIRTSAAMGLIFTGNGAANANHLHILKDGQVGIGTSTVGSHKLAVEGSIGAREIKVEATGWSDYVFEAGYPLKPLREVEAYIDENKHLPGIPSAAEVAEQGINVGEMNAKLLEKIEELTLYLIDQNKQLANQQKEIEELKASLIKLENK